MILFLSDFGLNGPYVGQVRAVLAERAPGVPVIDLMHDLPRFRPRAAGCLLEAFDRTSALSGFMRGSVFLAVVDPGVGTARMPLIVETSGHRFVGPDNGLFAQVGGQGVSAQAWRIDWRPEHLSDSFHGRDLFAPVAAMLARGEPVPGTPVPISELSHAEWSEPPAEIVYIDRYGNAMTGLDARSLDGSAVLEAAGHRLSGARTFGDVPPDTGFWYANSLGLAEIAVNHGSAAEKFALAVGSPVTVVG